MAKNGKIFGVSFGPALGLVIAGFAVGVGFTLAGMVTRGGVDIFNKYVPGVIPPEIYNARTAFGTYEDAINSGYDVMADY